MSSYVVDPKTINHIVSGILNASRSSRAYPAIKPNGPGGTPYPWMHSELFVANSEDAASLGLTLYEMNVNATSQRYSDNARDEIPGTYTNGKQLDNYAYEFQHTSIFTVYGAIGEYLYQCSEGDVDQLPLFAAVSHWHDALAHKLAAMFIDETQPKSSEWRG